MRSLLDVVDTTFPAVIEGQVHRVLGLTVESRGLFAPVGGQCEIDCRSGQRLAAEVVGFRQEHAIVAPYGDIRGISAGDRIVYRGETSTVRVGPGLIGHVIDAEGRLLECGQRLDQGVDVPLHRIPVNPLQGRQIERPLPTGVRAIDGVLTVGRGQRMGTLLRHRSREEHADGNDRAEHRGLAGRHRPHRRAASRGAGVRRSQPRSRRAAARGGGGRHERGAGAQADPGGSRGDRHRGVLPRHVQGRALARRFAHARRHGTARARAFLRGAADDEGLSAVGLLASSEAARAGGSDVEGQHHRLLYRARRGRRPARSGGRLCEQRSGRASVALPPSRPRRGSSRRSILWRA